MPFRNSSMTTVAEAAPNLPSSIFPNSSLASCKSLRINTPLPAAKPSAFSTYGAFTLSRNLQPSLRLSLLTLKHFAVGTPYFAMKSLAKALLPSNWAPRWSGPMIFTAFSSASPLKKSTMPSTKGCSGPTTTRLISCFKQKSFTASKSDGFISTFTPTCAVPALPGAMKTCAPSLWANFHAKACSRPPEPSTNMLRFTAVICCP